VSGQVYPVDGHVPTASIMYRESHMTATADVTFVLKNKEEIRAHRCVVSALSLPLHNILYPPSCTTSQARTSSTEAPTPATPAHATSGAAATGSTDTAPAAGKPELPASVTIAFTKAQFKVVLDYAYLGHCGSWDVDEAKAVLAIADYYVLESLAKVAEKSIVQSLSITGVDLKEAYLIYTDAKETNRNVLQTGLIYYSIYSNTTQMRGGGLIANFGCSKQLLRGQAPETARSKTVRENYSLLDRR